jgi:hypothetical protein
MFAIGNHEDEITNPAQTLRGRGSEASAQAGGVGSVNRCGISMARALGNVRSATAPGAGYPYRQATRSISRRTVQSAPSGFGGARSRH